MTNLEIKHAVLAHVGAGQAFEKVGKATYRMGGARLHVRYASVPGKDGRFSFNLNPNTLQSDYDVWICGGVETWFLIPCSVLKVLYDDPDAYRDRRHHEIRVLGVDLERRMAIFGKGLKSQDLRTYYCRTLRSLSG